MAVEFEIAITFIVYLLFFAWLGYRRGFRAEMTVFLVALLGWIGLMVFGDVVVTLANLFGKFVAFALSGGLGEGGDAAFEALRTAPDVITEANRESFLFVIWVILVVITYVVTTTQATQRRQRGTPVIPLTPGALADALAGVFAGQRRAAAPPPDARLRGWSVILGIANGLLFASIFLPRLLALLAPQTVAYTGIPDSTSPFRILGAGLRVVFDAIGQLWELIQPQGSWVLLILLTLFLILVAGTLRGGRGGNAGANS
ncbi:MAG: hypothetical protein DCC55_06610 [Chloroflexi bacterium]|nr:MAG: hypothetical protein DCC55_06610 [Chloroflexota bacterium]